MINELKAEIAELEKVLLEKKKSLYQLLEKPDQPNGDQLIVIIKELDIDLQNIYIYLIDNNPEKIEEFEEAHVDTYMHHYEWDFYKVENIKEDYNYLKQMLSLVKISEDSINEWIEKNKGNVANIWT